MQKRRPEKPLRALVVAPLLLLLLLPFLGGCDDDHHDTATTQILSSWYDDGNIVRHGDDTYEPFFPPPASDNDIWVGLYGTEEWRGFLQFPLAGYGGVPAGVGIHRATLDLVVRSVDPGMRLWVDLVAVGDSLASYGTANPDFLWSERVVPSLASVAVDLPPVSSPGHVTVDVTPLMDASQSLYPPPATVQFRLRLDPGARAGLTVITDPFDDIYTAPLLEVEYDL